MINKTLILLIGIVMLVLAGCSTNTEQNSQNNVENINIQDQVEQTNLNTQNNSGGGGENLQTRYNIDFSEYVIAGDMFKGPKGYAFFLVNVSNVVENYIFYDGMRYGPFDFVTRENMAFSGDNVYFYASRNNNSGIYQNAELVIPIQDRIRQIKVDDDENIFYIKSNSSGHIIGIGNSENEVNTNSQILNIKKSLNGQIYFFEINTELDKTTLYGENLQILEECDLSGSRVIETNNYFTLQCFHIEENIEDSQINFFPEGIQSLEYITDSGEMIRSNFSGNLRTLNLGNSQIYSTSRNLQAVIEYDGSSILTLEEDNNQTYYVFNGNLISEFEGFMSTPKIVNSENFIFSTSELQNETFEIMVYKNNDLIFQTTSTPTRFLRDRVQYDFDEEGNIHIVTLNPSNREYEYYLNSELVTNSSQTIDILYSDSNEFVIYFREESRLEYFSK